MLTFRKCAVSVPRGLPDTSCVSSYIISCVGHSSRKEKVSPSVALLFQMRSTSPKKQGCGGSSPIDAALACEALLLCEIGFSKDSYQRVTLR